MSKLWCRQGYKTSRRKTQMKLFQILWYVKASVDWFIIQKGPQFTAKEAKAMAGWHSIRLLESRKDKNISMFICRRSYYGIKELEITDSAVSGIFLKMLIYWSNYSEMEQKRIGDLAY